MGKSQKAARLFGRAHNGHGKEKKGQAQKEERRRTNNNGKGGSKLADVVAARRNEWDYPAFSPGENYAGEEDAAAQGSSSSPSSSTFAVLPASATTTTTKTDHARRGAELAHLHGHYQQDPTRARLLGIYKAHMLELTEMQVEQLEEVTSAKGDTVQARAQAQDLMKWHRESVGFFAKEISRDIILG